jgi:hypothetical protein
MPIGAVVCHSRSRREVDALVARDGAGRVEAPSGEVRRPGLVARWPRSQGVVLSLQGCWPLLRRLAQLEWAWLVQL